MHAEKTYYLFRFLFHFGMSATVTGYVPLLLEVGLSLGEVALINGVFWVSVIALEIPTGLIADGRSRAYSLRMGMGFLALGALVYLFVQNVWTAILGEVVISAGVAFISGALTAWITDALDREGQIHRLGEVFANAEMIRGATSLCGGFLGAYIASLNLRLIWAPMVLSGFLAILVSHAWMNGKGEPLERLTEWEAFQASVGLLRRSYALVWVIGSMVLFGLVVSFNHFWTPYFLEMTDQRGLGFVWMAIYLSLTGGGWLVRQMRIPSGAESMAIVVSVLVTGFGLVLIPFAPGITLSILMVMIHEFGRGMNTPLLDSFVQHRVESGYRATFGSVQSFLGRAGFAIVPFVVWLFLSGKPDSSETISIVWMFSGSALMMGAILLWLVRPTKTDT